MARRGLLGCGVRGRWGKGGKCGGAGWGGTCWGGGMRGGGVQWDDSGGGIHVVGWVTWGVLIWGGGGGGTWEGQLFAIF